MATAAVALEQNVAAFLEGPKKMLIDGQWVSAASGKTFATHNPATGDVLTHVAEGERADIDRAVRAARRAFESGPWPTMSPSDRGRLIWKLADLLEERLKEFSQLESLDNGKPVSVARVADLPLSVDHLRYMAGWATKIEGSTIPISVKKHVAWTVREPVGVVAQIVPWNFPLLMTVWKLGPALAAGCTLVLKPAEQTPLSALWLGELIMEAGFPGGW
jgi:phenylacetaldehyde dehydrogenase